MSLADLSRTPSAPGRPSPDAVLAAARRLRAETWAAWMHRLYRAIVGLIRAPAPGSTTTAVPSGRPLLRFRTQQV